jgi:3-hydroxyisobutyrate dehydrogenase-like beta-hydroxyacid dehydrogenase
MQRVPNSRNSWRDFADVLPQGREVIAVLALMPGTKFIAAQDEAIGVTDAPAARVGRKAARGILTMPAGADTMVVQRYWRVRAACDKNLLHLGPWGCEGVGKLVSNLLSVGSNKSQLE